MTGILAGNGFPPNFSIPFCHCVSQPDSFVSVVVWPLSPATFEGLPKLGSISKAAYKLSPTRLAIDSHLHLINKIFRSYIRCLVPYHSPFSPSPTSAHDTNVHPRNRYRKAPQSRPCNPRWPPRLRERHTNHPNPQPLSSAHGPLIWGLAQAKCTRGNSYR